MAERKLTSTEKALVKLDTIRPYVRNAVFAAAPTAAMARAFDVAPGKIRALALAAGGVGALDHHISELAKKNRKSQALLKNYSQEHRTVKIALPANATKIADGSDRERTSLTDFVLSHRPQPVEVRKTASAPAIKESGLPWSSAPILQSVRAVRDAVERLTIEQT